MTAPLKDPQADPRSVTTAQLDAAAQQAQAAGVRDFRYPVTADQAEWFNDTVEQLQAAGAEVTLESLFAEYAERWGFDTAGIELI